tara:strand:- start:10518 stop:11555 length:1038 start_codon:yes stop_codon:yes gene_type:complete
LLLKLIKLIELNTKKLKVGISVGDPNGIGIEVILKSFQNPETLRLFNPVIFANIEIIEYQMRLFNINLKLNSIQKFEEFCTDRINVYNLSLGDFKHTFGKATIQGGQVALKSLLASAKALNSGEIEALVTAPINKKNILSETFNFIGHTEFLSNLFSSESLMFMIGENLKVGLLTDHIPIDKVSSFITKKALRNKILKMIKSMQNDFLIPRPKIAILGLNPHAGDNGLIGNQDEKIIKPVIEKLKKENNSVFGPFSADSFFVKSNLDKYDTVLAMYHDQGLIPFKTLNFGSGVNFTSGLPIVRTSPDHGTAYDIAGSGIASYTSFKKALLLARGVYNNRLNKKPF